MERAITITRARIESLADARLPGGAPLKLTRRMFGALAAQIAQSDSYEVRVDGALAAIGGFAPAPDLDITESWLLGGPALKTALRASIDGIAAVLDVAAERFGVLGARVCEGAENSARFVGLLGFAPSDLAEDGHRWALYGAPGGGAGGVA